MDLTKNNLSGIVSVACDRLLICYPRRYKRPLDAFDVFLTYQNISTWDGVWSVVDDDHVPGVDSMIRWFRTKRRGNYTDNSSTLIVNKKHKPPRSEPLVQAPVTEIILGKRGRAGPVGPRGNGRRHLELEAITNFLYTDGANVYIHL